MAKHRFPPHSIIVPSETNERLEQYLKHLVSGTIQPGKLMAERIAQEDLGKFSVVDLVVKLLQTKFPQIFAESAVWGDGSDWSLVELSLLGDLSVGVSVEIFDNGHHTAPQIHEPPIHGTLVFTPGALLRNGCGCIPADWNEAVASDGTISPDGYFNLYKRRLLPVLDWINARSQQGGSPAFITMPGLGCGQFAGPFQGELGAMLETVLRRLLTEYGRVFSDIRAIYFDPYSECANHREKIQGIDFLVRPLRMPGNSDKPQLCPPSAYEESPGEFNSCELYSIVAWDHVSWPGNDFFINSRCTDDGVKAAATDSMFRITGIQGKYDRKTNKYLPPKELGDWRNVARNPSTWIQPELIGFSKF